MAGKCVIRGRKRKGGKKGCEGMKCRKGRWGGKLEKVGIVVEGKGKRVYV
nr:50S ribosomal protein L28 [Bacillus altitudinis]